LVYVDIVFFKLDPVYREFLLKPTDKENKALNGKIGNVAGLV
jgi:hypothetical protein